MMEEKRKERQTVPKKPAATCRVSLDEDEMGRFTSGQTGRCPYFRYYDEYKSVHKQI